MLKTLLAALSVALFASSAIADDCKNACNKKCDGAKNKSKCVAECRRACDGK